MGRELNMLRKDGASRLQSPFPDEFPETRVEWDTAVFVPENTTHPRLCHLIKPSVQEFERCEKTDGYKKEVKQGRRGERTVFRGASPRPLPSTRHRQQDRPTEPGAPRRAETG